MSNRIYESDASIVRFAPKPVRQMRSPTTEQLVTAFHTGTLDRQGGQFVPCTYFSLWFSLPFAAIAYIIPFVAIVGVVLSLFNGSDQSQTYIRNFLNSDRPTQLVVVLFLGIALVVGTCPLLNYWPTLELDVRGLRESWRERRTGEKRYGLLLTSDYFALRCFSLGYDEPFIVRRDRITVFNLYSEYSSTSHQRHKYIVMTVNEPGDRERHYRFPDHSIALETHKLHRTLIDWLEPDKS